MWGVDDLVGGGVVLEDGDLGWGVAEFVLGQPCLPLGVVEGVGGGVAGDGLEGVVGEEFDDAGVLLGVGEVLAAGVVEVGVESQFGGGVVEADGGEGEEAEDEVAVEAVGDFGEACGDTARGDADESVVLDGDNLDRDDGGGAELLLAARDDDAAIEIEGGKLNVAEPDVLVVLDGLL